jgi:cell shape-determining protein MreD
MVNFFIRSIFLFVVVVFQMSFLNVVSANTFANAILATAIALTLTRGFSVAWPWIVGLGCLFDILSLDIVGITALILIVFSYGISFLSRRFLVEHKESGMLLAVLFMMVSSVVYFPILWILRHFIFGIAFSFNSLHVYVSTLNIVYGMMLNASLFVVMYILTSKMHHILDFYEERVIVKR